MTSVRINAVLGDNLSASSWRIFCGWFKYASRPNDVGHVSQGYPHPRNSNNVEL